MDFPVGLASREELTNYELTGKTLTGAIADSEDERTVLLQIDPANPLVTGDYELIVKGNLTLNADISSDFSYEQLEVTGLVTSDEYTIEVTFNQAVDPLTTTDPTKYAVVFEGGSRTIDQLEIAEEENNVVEIKILDPLLEDVDYQLNVSHISNETKNSLVSAELPFTFVIPLRILDVLPISDSSLEVVFNKPIEETSATTLGNYSVDNGVGNPFTAQKVNDKTVQLLFSADFGDQDYQLSASNIFSVDGQEIQAEFTRPLS